MTWSNIALIALVFGGCAIQTEPCGFDFVEDADGRCVPVDPPPPYYATAEAARLGSLEATTAAPESWAGFDAVRIVDRTPPRLTAVGRGCDLDAVVLEGDEAATAVEVLGASAGIDAAAALGLADAESPAGPGFASLGGAGGFVHLRLGRAVKSGDAITAFGAADEGASIEVQLCPGPAAEAQRCFLLGRGSGTLRLHVP